jgi:hypothetical protein
VGWGGKDKIEGLQSRPTGQKAKLYHQNNQIKKDWSYGSSDRVPSMRPWVEMAVIKINPLFLPGKRVSIRSRY